MELNLLLAEQIGAHLKSLRKLRGLSQAQLGQRLGVGQARVAAIEADPGAVSVEQLLRVFQVLGVDLVARVKPGSATLTQAQTLLEEVQAKALLEKAQARLEAQAQALLEKAHARLEARLEAQAHARLEAQAKALLEQAYARLEARLEAQAQSETNAKLKPETQTIEQAKTTPEAAPTKVAPRSAITPKAAAPLAIKKNKGQW